MVNTRSSHPNGDPNTNDSYKDRHIKVYRCTYFFLYLILLEFLFRKLLIMNKNHPTIPLEILKVHHIIK
jgi:hypothetical protein